VLFCDIVGFTGMSENLPAVQVVDRLNRMYRVMTKVIADNEGTLHKFGGDMLMAFWNVMLPDPRAEINAIRAALQLQSAVWSINLGLAAEGQRPIHVGIGCNTGELAGGNIGGRDRMEYTVIGDNVNLGQRIESLAGRWQAFTSQATYESARELSSAVGLPLVCVKGRREPIKVYSIRGIQEQSGRMLLAIPVAILTPDGNEGVPGMLTACEAPGTPEATVELVTGPEMVSWETLVVKMELGELEGAVHLNAKVRNMERMMRESTRVQYTRLTLGDLAGDTAARSLLCPGTLLESNKSWERMKRA
jgi:class 3 adenylate cyclase